MLPSRLLILEEYGVHTLELLQLWVNVPQEGEEAGTDSVSTDRIQDVIMSLRLPGVASIYLFMRNEDT